MALWSNSQIRAGAARRAILSGLFVAMVLPLLAGLAAGNGVLQ